MSTYRINGIKYNPANWAGLDPAERAACNRFAAARERELNTITAETYTCDGGPFAGHQIEVESTTRSTASMTVGAWCGRYELQGNKTSADRLVWVGNDGGQAINTHHHTTDQKKAGADVTGRGFDQLRDLLADLAEDPAERAEPAPTEEKPERLVARYTIGRTVYTIDATPEAADRLRARITKAKRWFSDKLLQAARPAKAPSVKPAAPAPVPASAPETVPALAAAVAIGSAQAQAAKTCATGCANPRAFVAVAAVDLERLTNSFNFDTTRRAKIEAGRRGDLGALPYIRAELQRLAEQPGHSVGAMEARQALQALVQAMAEEQQPDTDTAADEAAELVTCDGPELAETAAALADTPAAGCDAIGATDTRTEADPADCTQAPETLAPDCTEAPETPAGAGALSIRLERWEGLVDECGQPVTVGSFAEADRVLLAWSETAPEHGGYNKCGFLITWPDGDTYEGRFDLVHHRRERPSLRDHISGQAEFWLGTGCPMHMGEQEYQDVISRATEETRAQWSAVLDLLRLHAAYFPRTQPSSCPDLRALVDHLKIEPAELVGLGVTTYRPNERDLKRGAITEAETVEGRWSGAPQLLAVVTYEDGTREHIEADGFKDHNNHRHTRRRLNLQRHGAPYLAQLAAAAAAQKAAASSAAERKAQAEQKARADLLEKFAHLEQGHGCVVAARNMRTLLKAAYPGVKFSVKTQQYSGGNNITVHWTDGPTDEAVGAIVNQFKHGSFNGMDDGYEFSRDPFPELFGGCYYTHAHRDESPELIERALVQHFPNAETRPSVQDWQNRRGLFDFRNVYTGREAEAYAAEFRRTLASIDATPPAKAARGAKA